MNIQIKQIVARICSAFQKNQLTEPSASIGFRPSNLIDSTFLKTAVIIGAVSFAGYQLVKHPPMQEVPHGFVGLRSSLIDSTPTLVSAGNVLMLPAIHTLRLLDLRDQTYSPVEMRSAGGNAPLQSIEGLSFGMDVHVQYTIDQTKLNTSANKLPDNIGASIIAPAVQGSIYRIVAGYTIKEVFTNKRVPIQQSLEAALKPKLAADGLVLKSVQIGNVDLPADYKRGMEAMLSEELAIEKMHYTLDLKEKHIQEIALEAEAEKTKRQKNAEAAAIEQVIAAKAQEDAMKHILPFKEKQIQQRQLEAEADKQSRIKNAEGNAKARTIEAIGEAESRQKLADAEVYRLERVGKANAEQMQREGILVTQHPLLIQKAMADKLSDKIQVIIAPPNTNGFIASNLIGSNNTAANNVPAAHSPVAAANAEEAE